MSDEMRSALKVILIPVCVLLITMLFIVAARAMYLLLVWCDVDQFIAGVFTVLAFFVAAGFGMASVELDG